MPRLEPRQSLEKSSIQLTYVSFPNLSRQRFEQEKQAREDAERQQQLLMDRLKRFEEETKEAQEGWLKKRQAPLLDYDLVVVVVLRGSALVSFLQARFD